MPKKKSILNLSPFVLIITGVSVLIIALICTPMFLPNYSYDGGFSSFSQIEEYAKSHDEMLPLENDNLYRPDFSDHYKTYRAQFYWSGLRWLTTSIGLSSHDNWNIFSVKRLVSSVLHSYEKKELKKHYIQRISPKDGDRFIFIGDLLGAFHSLVRSLQDLKKRGIIDSRLVLQDKNTRFIFMGDAISRSAYGLETLSLILALINANPDRVIHMRGNHEDNKYWHAFGMKDQIETIFAEEGKAEAKELVSSIDSFFQRLPDGLFLRLPHFKERFVQISHLSRKSNKYLDEKYISNFLLLPQKDSVDGYQISRKKKSKKEIDIEAVFRSEKKRDSFQVSKGLRTLSSNEGGIAWTLFSSPSLVSQKGLKFNHDAYAELVVGKHEVNWHITLHSHQAGSNNPEFELETYEFFSGKKNTITAITQLSKAIIKKNKNHKKASKKSDDNFEDELIAEDAFSFYEDMGNSAFDEEEAVGSKETPLNPKKKKKKKEHETKKSSLVIEELADDGGMILTMELDKPAKKTESLSQKDYFKGIGENIEPIPKEAFVTKIDDVTTLIFVPVDPFILTENEADTNKLLL